MRHRLKRWLLKLLIALMLLFKCVPAHAENPYPVVHLLQGEPAPYAGDLLQPVTVMTLAAEHKQLGMVKRKLATEKKMREDDRVTYEAKLEAMRTALEASEHQKVPVPPPVEGPGFFERPVVWGVIGLTLGIALGYGAAQL